MMKRIFTLKSFLIIIVIILMLLGMSGCSQEVELKEQNINGVTLDVPSDYKKFKDENGLMVGTAPNASITVSPLASTGGLKSSWWTKETLTNMYKNTYSDIVIKSIKSDVKKDNLPSIYANFTGKDKNGDNLDIHMVILYKNQKESLINYVMITLKDECSTSQFINEIIKSINLKEY